MKSDYDPIFSSTAFFNWRTLGDGCAMYTDALKAFGKNLVTVGQSHSRNQSFVPPFRCSDDNMETKLHPNPNLIIFLSC